MHKALLQSEKEWPQTVIILHTRIVRAFWKQQALIWLAGLAQFPAQVFESFSRDSFVYKFPGCNNEQIQWRNSLPKFAKGLLRWMSISLLSWYINHTGSVFCGYATYHNPDVIKYHRDNGLWIWRLPSAVKTPFPFFMRRRDMNPRDRQLFMRLHWGGSNTAFIWSIWH